MPIRRGMGGVSSGAGGNLFDRPGFFDYAEIAQLVLDSDLLLKTASETYGIYLGHGDTSGASQHYTATIPALSADGEMVVTTAGQNITVGNLTSTAAIDWDLLDNNASALSFDTTGKTGILEIVTTNGSEKVAMSGDLTIAGDLTVSGTSTTIDSTTLSVDDKNIEMGSVSTPTDVTANGGGITLKGATDKTIIWDNTNDNWTSNQDWNLASGKSYKINNTVLFTATTLGSSIINSSLTSTGVLNSGSINTGFGNINIGTSVVTAGQLNIDNIRIDGNTVSSTSGELILDAVSSLNFSDDAVLAIGTMTLDALHGAANAIQIGDNSNDAISIYGVTNFTASGNLDIGAHGFRANTLTADGLTSGRVVFAGTDGVLSEDANNTFTFNDSTNTLSVSTLAATNINAFALQGKLTAGANEIEGSAFDITGGTVAGVTATSLTLNSGSVGGSLTWGASQNLGSHALTNVNVDSGTVNMITSFGIKQAATTYEMQIAVGSTTLGANRVVTIDPNNAARTLDISGDITFANAFTTSGNYALTLTTTGTTNVTLPTTGTLATIAGTETLTSKTLTAPVISSISNSGTITLPTSTDTLVGRATTDTLTSKTISGANNTLSNIGNSSLSNSAITIGGTSTSLGGTITALTALTDLDLTSGSKTIFDTVGSNTLTLGGSGTTINIAGDLTVQGTTTTTNTESQTVDDPIFQLGGESAPSNDDNKDRGIAFRWHNGSAAKNGFFGYDDSTSKFTFIPDATINNEVVSGTAGTLVATTFEGALSGNASTATSAGRWTTARALSFTGDVTGTGNVDGSAPVATALTIATNAVQAAMVHEDVISGRTELTSGNVATASDFLLLWDATDSTYKKVKPDNLGVSGLASGSANELQYNNSNAFAGATNVEIKNNHLAFKEVGSAPGNTSGFGMMYAKTDNELYYKDDGGNETKITSAGSLAGGGAFKGVKAYLSANNSISNNSATTPTVWTESYDVGAFHDGSTNTDRFTFGQTGYFVISVQQEWAADAVGYREMRVTHTDTSNSNATNVILRDRMDGSSSATISSASTTFYVDDAADYVTIQLYQNSGAALNAIGNNDDSTAVTISRLDMASSTSQSSGGSGHIQFSDGSGGFSSDSNAIFWDATNNRLGVNTGSPAYSIDTTTSGTVRAQTFTGALAGNATTATTATLASTVTVVDSTDTSSFIAMFDSATGSLAAKTDAGLTYNAGTGMLTATGFTGPLTGNAATVTNGVYTTGNQTVGGVKTFSDASTFSDNITLDKTLAENKWIFFKTAISGTAGDNHPMGLAWTFNASDNSNDYASIKMDYGDRGTAGEGLKMHTANGYVMTFDAGNDMAFQTDDVTRMTITNGGAVNFGVDDTGTQVTFFGATAGKDMMWDQAADRLEFKDNTYMSMGTDADMIMYHTGNSFTMDNNTGNFTMDTANNSDFVWKHNNVQIGFIDTSAATMYIGLNDATPGIFHALSGGAGNPEGGELRLGTAADYDATYNYYFIDAYQDDLRMGRAGVVDFTLTAAGTNTWKGSGDFSYGSGGAVNAIKYFDLWNSSNTATTDAIDLRLITRNTANDGTSAVNIIKRYNGEFSIGNADTHANAYLRMYVGSSATNGIHINSSGNVGLGDDAPETILHLKSAAPDISYEDTDGGDKYIAGNNGGNFRIRNATDSRTDFNIDGTGNIGIGSTPTTDAQQKLQIIGTSNVDGTNPVTLRLYNTRTGGFTAGTQNTNIDFASADESGSWGAGEVRARIGMVNELGNGTATALGFWTGAAAASAVSKGMQLSSEGKLGIGTITPTTRLDVVDNSSGNHKHAVFGSQTISSGTTREGGIVLTASNSDDRSWGLWADANNPRAFRIEYLGARATNLGSGTTIATFDYGGNVGIGTSGVPSAKLHVSGSSFFTNGDMGVGTAAASGTGKGRVHIDGNGDNALLIGSGTLEGTARNESVTFLEANNGSGGSALRWLDGSGNVKTIIYGSVPSNSYAAPTHIWSSGNISFYPGMSAEEFRFETDGDFHADGDVYAFSGSVGSDIALKENINVIDHALDKISQLKGVSFDWKRENKGSSAGLIAQDVEKVLPELVTDVDSLSDDGSYKYLNYNGIIGLLVESIKELKNEIRELKNGTSR